MPPLTSPANRASIGLTPQRDDIFTEDILLELKDIKIIIDLMKKNDLSVFEMEKEGFKIKLKKGFRHAGELRHQ